MDGRGQQRRNKMLAQQGDGQSPATAPHDVRPGPLARLSATASRISGGEPGVAMRLRRVLKGARLGLWEYDVASAALRLDPSAGRLLGGAPARQWLKLPHGTAWAAWLTNVHPADRRVLDAFLAAFQAGQRCEAEYGCAIRRETGPGWRTAAT